MFLRFLFNFAWFRNASQRRAATRQQLKNEVQVQRELASMRGGNNVWLEREMRAVEAEEQRGKRRNG